jgi:hypothetical protein
VGDDRGAAAVVDGGGAGSGGDHSALHTPVMYARQGASSKTVRGNPGVCQLLDVGLVPDAYWIVMPQYSCSLAQWRAFPQQQPPSQPQVAALYLAVLIQVGEGGRWLRGRKCACVCVFCACVSFLCVSRLRQEIPTTASSSNA